jgi:hypothetical protein
MASSSNNLDGMDWINLAPVSDKRRAVVNTVLNLPVPQNADNFLLA